jgi:predicted nucleotidyltransferase
MLLQKLLKIDISNEEIDHLVLGVSNHFLNFCQPEAIVLFGSAARRDMHINSDLDLAFIFNDKDMAAKMQKELRIQAPKCGWALDIVCLDSETFHRKKKLGGLCMLIQRDARVLYSSEGFKL